MSEVKVRGPLPPKSRMADVCFRFYGRLNDFLPAARRGSRFTYRLRHLPSVKDAIESLGVPHPEVDVILVNGSPGIDPPSVIRFAVDVHLGKLASLLRLAGFDAVVMPDDSDVAAMASRDARIALTRDVNLLKRRVLRHGYWVRSTDPEWQLTEVLERFDLVSRMEPFARCLRCNVPVVAVDAEAVAARLLPRTRAAFWQFHRCPECDRIYWQGSHYDRLCQLLERARERVVARTNDVRGNAW
jgi:hypothetical protein